MTAKVFFDTNALVYAANVTGKDKPVVRKAARPIPPVEAFEWIEQLVAFPCQPIDHELVRIAVEISERFSISYWDAAALAAAEALGASTVYAEDLNDE